MSRTLALIEDSGVVAIMRANTSEQLIEAADAIMAGGVIAIEVTMTTPGALKVLEEARGRYGEEVLFGVGSVLDSETARVAIMSGAQFVVCPTLSLETIETCRRYSVPVVPGAYTPTEVLTAWQAGADCVKIFPASFGGPPLIRALLAPLPQVKLMPVGGVNQDTTEAFIRAGASSVGVGSALISQKLLDERAFNEITKRARDLREAVQRGRN